MTTTLTAKSTYAALKPRERLFVDEYVKNMRVADAALAAGYTKSSSRGIGTTLMQRSHVALAISKALEEKSMLARIDASWVLKRLALIADFSIKNFIVVDDNTGRLHYDFQNATDDDWYCINEITISAVRAKHNRGDKLWIDEVKIKTTPQIKALELLGKHVDVQAFKERAGASTEPVTEVTRRVVRPGSQSLTPSEVTQPPSAAPPAEPDRPRIAHPKVPISGPVR